MVCVRFHDHRTVVLVPTLLYLLNLNKPTQKKKNTHKKEPTTATFSKKSQERQEKDINEKKKKIPTIFGLGLFCVSSSEVHRTRRAKKRDRENMEFVWNVICCCPYSQPQYSYSISNIHPNITTILYYL